MLRRILRNTKLQGTWRPGQFNQPTLGHLPRCNKWPCSIPIVSLTSMLDDSTGSLRRWWDQELPDASRVATSGRWTQPVGLVAPASISGGTLGIVGAAVDYRYRWLWRTEDCRDSVALLGARDLLGASAELRIGMAADRLLQDHSGSDRFGANDVLDRLSVVFARFESVYRSGLSPDPSSGISDGAELHEMLVAQRADIVSEVKVLTDSLTRLLSGSGTATLVANPVFSGSSLVGGADADFILDSTLIELKTTKNASVPANDLRQLVSYALLDLVDDYSIRRVALAYPRRPQLLEWDLEELLRRLGSTRTRLELSQSLERALRAA